jgi:hypothetical protein
MDSRTAGLNPITINHCVLQLIFGWIATANIQRSRIRFYRCSVYRSERGQSGIWSNRKLVSVIGEVAMNVRYDHGALANS